jgi:hypothetical protein
MVIGLRLGAGDSLELVKAAKARIPELLGSGVFCF